MNWLRFLMSDETKEPSTLTPKTAEPILDVVSEALQQNDGLPFHPRSSLKGYDVFQVDAALKSIPLPGCVKSTRCLQWR